MLNILRRLAAATVVMGALAACHAAHVETVADYAGPQLQRPHRVLVSGFAVSPEQVQLDQGVFARIRRASGDAPLSAQQREAAYAIRTAIATQLVQQLRRYGLPAEIATGAAPPRGSLLVEGQIVGIDQGNRTRRVLIGLGAGRSSIAADTQLYYVAGAARPRLLTAFQGQADSGRAPGAAETMGISSGPLAVAAATSAVSHFHDERHVASGSAEARRLADGIARQIAQFAVAQGWLPPGAVR